MRVVILGASAKPERYAHKAQRDLVEAGHEVFPVAPAGETILDEPVSHSLAELPGAAQPIHTLTVYINPDRFRLIWDEVMEAKPERLLFNPGTELGEAEETTLREAGIKVEHGCTLVMLRAGTF